MTRVTQLMVCGCASDVSFVLSRSVRTACTVIPLATLKIFYSCAFMRYRVWATDGWTIIVELHLRCICRWACLSVFHVIPARLPTKQG